MSSGIIATMEVKWHVFLLVLFTIPMLSHAGPSLPQPLTRIASGLSNSQSGLRAMDIRPMELSVSKQLQHLSSRFGTLASAAREMNNPNNETLADLARQVQTVAKAGREMGSLLGGLSVGGDKELILQFGVDKTVLGGPGQMGFGSGDGGIVNWDFAGALQEMVGRFSKQLSSGVTVNEAEGEAEEPEETGGAGGRTAGVLGLGGLMEVAMGGGAMFGSNLVEVGKQLADLNPMAFEGSESWLGSGAIGLSARLQKLTEVEFKQLAGILGPELVGMGNRLLREESSDKGINGFEEQHGPQILVNGLSAIAKELQKVGMDTAEGGFAPAALKGIGGSNLADTSSTGKIQSRIESLMRGKASNSTAGLASLSRSISQRGIGEGGGGLIRGMEADDTLEEQDDSSQPIDGLVGLIGSGLGVGLLGERLANVGDQLMSMNRLAFRGSEDWLGPEGGALSIELEKLSEFEFKRVAELFGPELAGVGRILARLDISEAMQTDESNNNAQPEVLSLEAMRGGLAYIQKELQKIGLNVSNLQGTPDLLAPTVLKEFIGSSNLTISESMGLSNLGNLKSNLELFSQMSSGLESPSPAREDMDEETWRGSQALKSLRQAGIGLREKTQDVARKVIGNTGAGSAGLSKITGNVVGAGQQVLRESSGIIDKLGLGVAAGVHGEAEETGEEEDRFSSAGVDLSFDDLVNRVQRALIDLQKEATVFDINGGVRGEGRQRMNSLQEIAKGLNLPSRPSMEDVEAALESLDDDSLGKTLEGIIRNIPSINDLTASAEDGVEKEGGGSWRSDMNRIVKNFLIELAE